MKRIKIALLSLVAATALSSCAAGAGGDGDWPDDYGDGTTTRWVEQPSYSNGRTGIVEKKMPDGTWVRCVFSGRLRASSTAIDCDFANPLPN